MDSLDVLRLVVDACAAPARVRTVLGFALRDVAVDYAQAMERAAEAERRAELAEAALDDATRLIGDRVGS